MRMTEWRICIEKYVFHKDWMGQAWWTLIIMQVYDMLKIYIFITFNIFSIGHQRFVWLFHQRNRRWSGINYAIYLSSFSQSLSTSSQTNLSVDISVLDSATRCPDNVSSNDFVTSSVVRVIRASEYRLRWSLGLFTSTRVKLRILQVVGCLLGRRYSSWKGCVTTVVNRDDRIRPTAWITHIDINLAILSAVCDWNAWSRWSNERVKDHGESSTVWGKWRSNSSRRTSGSTISQTSNISLRRVWAWSSSKSRSDESRDKERHFRMLYWDEIEWPFYRRRDGPIKRNRFLDATEAYGPSCFPVSYCLARFQGSKLLPISLRNSGNVNLSRCKGCTLQGDLSIVTFSGDSVNSLRKLSCDWQGWQDCKVEN